jgi:hypothetical protein
MTLKVQNRIIEPDRLAQIKLHTNLLQSPKNLMRARIVTAIGDTGILQHMIILKGTRPQTKHKSILLHPIILIFFPLRKQNKEYFPGYHDIYTWGLLSEEVLWYSDR